jgi:dTDP-4-amino-4,6-dideoxy-D-galactose acyltransferase
MRIKTVKWDSDFFKLKIGKLETDDFSITDFETEKNKFDLIYIQSATDSLEYLEALSFSSLFEDRKLIYTKQINISAQADENISIYKNKTANKNLIRLALLSGAYSRFKLDSNFKKKSYEHLYTKWIENSVNKKMAFCVLIYGDEKNPDGFISIQKKGNEAQVGLFTVNDNARNKGIGKKLLEAAEYYAQKHNFDTLNITTQASNKPACMLYEKCGFTVKSSINTFHYWNK